MHKLRRYNPDFTAYMDSPNFTNYINIYFDVGIFLRTIKYGIFSSAYEEEIELTTSPPESFYIFYLSL